MSGTTVLVIVSRDYGELGNAMHFIKGLGPDVLVSLLIPASIVSLITEASSPRIIAYDSLADIVAALEAVKPSAVFMYSAYLLTIGGSFSLFKFLRLLRLVRSRNIPIATSDPFIGLLQSPASISLAEVMRLGKTGVSKWIATAFAPIIQTRMYLISRCLRSKVHIYPVRMLKKYMPEGRRYYCYFSDSRLDAATITTTAGEDKHWIFVLSDLDYKLQIATHGEEFVKSLANRIRDVVALGKRPIVIGPGELVTRLRMAGVGDDVNLLSEVRYNLYMRLLNSAEYAFFWNYYSFSIISRVIAHQPVFFFDEGHMVKILPQLRLAGIEVYYGGWMPPLMALDRTFDPAQMKVVAEESLEHYMDICGDMQNCSSPEEVLSEVCAHGLN